MDQRTTGVRADATPEISAEIDHGLARRMVMGGLALAAISGVLMSIP